MLWLSSFLSAAIIADRRLRLYIGVYRSNVVQAHCLCNWEVLSLSIWHSMVNSILAHEPLLASKHCMPCIQTTHWQYLTISRMRLSSHWRRSGALEGMFITSCWMWTGKALKNGMFIRPGVLGGVGGSCNNKLASRQCCIIILWVQSIGFM